MARPQRNDVDYFPFYCKTGNTNDYIEATYGNDGFAAWVKLLRELARTDYHYLNLSVKQKLMTIVAKCKVSEDVLMAIISDLVELGEFDAELWNENRIVWSEKFTSSIEDAYKKRNNKIFKKEELLQLLVSLGVRKPTYNELNSPVKPQSKVKESKEDKSILDNAGEETVLDSALVKKANDLTYGICEYFEISTNPMSKVYNAVDEFSTSLAHKNQLEIAALALKNYMAYKARAQQQKHGVLKWIGTKENHFQDGEWTMTDWDKKNKNYEQQVTQTIFRTGSAQVSGTNYTGGLRKTNQGAQ
jgi:hypothetical protein